MGSLESLLAGAFETAGHELFLVGGALRDELLGHPVREIDLATSARPEQTVGVLETVPDLTIYRLGEKFGTIGAVLDDSRAEITTYRAVETYSPGSRKPEVRFGSTLGEDLSRRDFTINAMARPAGMASNPGSTGLIDLFHGIADLNARVVRAVGEPALRFEEDPLRILRAVRFAADLSFEVDPSTWTSLVASARLLSTISRERVAGELQAMLLGPAPGRAFTFLRQSGALAVAVPELMALDALPEQGPYHAYSLWEHTFRVVEATPPDPITRWAALLHDIGKPETMSRDPDGRLRFFNHETAGALRAERILRDLRMNTQLTDSVVLLVSSHMKLHQYTDDWSDGAVRRLSWRLGDQFPRALDLARADAAGHGPNPWSYTGVRRLAERVNELSQQLPAATSPLTGAELMERYRRPAGPWVGSLKHALTDMVTDGELDAADKAGAWRVADRLEPETRE